MDTATAVLPAFLALLLLSPWPLLGSAQGQFSAGEWPRQPPLAPGSQGGRVATLPGRGTRIWGSFRGPGVRGRAEGERDVPRVCARWTVGPRSGRRSAQVTFVLATHCSSMRFALGAGWPGCAGVYETLLFLGNW